MIVNSVRVQLRYPGPNNEDQRTEGQIGSAIKRRLWALGCAFSLLVCLPLVKPWLEMGTTDDVSYTLSAQMLAQTGHIVYNGWATAILGWQLYLGAAFIKLFGFSFNVKRLSMLPVAMLTAFLSQRSMVRAGLSERNATLGTGCMQSTRWPIGRTAVAARRRFRFTIASGSVRAR